MATVLKMQRVSYFPLFDFSMPNNQTCIWAYEQTCVGGQCIGRYTQCECRDANNQQYFCRRPRRCLNEECNMNCPEWSSWSSCVGRRKQRSQRCKCDFFASPSTWSMWQSGINCIEERPCSETTGTPSIATTTTAPATTTTHPTVGTSTTTTTTTTNQATRPPSPPPIVTSTLPPTAPIVTTPKAPTTAPITWKPFPTYEPEPNEFPRAPLVSPLAVGLLAAAGVCLLITLLTVSILCVCRKNRKSTSEPKPKKTMSASGGPLTELEKKVFGGHRAGLCCSPCGASQMSCR